MNIIEVYKKYELPEHLQMHMLRVAACCMLILDNWNSEIKVNRESLLRIAFYMTWAIWQKYQRNKLIIKNLHI